MGRVRISILGMMSLVVMAAIASTALRSASDLWVSVFYTLTVVVLLTSVIAARFRPRRERAFWYGFAVFGWGSFLLGQETWIGSFRPADSSFKGDVVNSRLLTSQRIFFLVDRFGDPRTDPKEINFDEIKRFTANTIYIAQSLTTLALALGGGLVAALMNAQRMREAGVR